MPSFAPRERLLATFLAAMLGTGLAACAGNLRANPAVYEWHKDAVSALRSQLHVTLVKPKSTTAPVLVVFASGDGGLMGISKAMLQHLADSGYYVAGFSSREALGQLRDSSGRLNYVEMRDTLLAVIAEAKRSLNLPDDARTILTGMSRGSNMVIVGAGDRSLRATVRGAVAVALTGEADYLDIPAEGEGLPGVQKDKEGRLKTYPAIERLGSLPLAIIQSTNDNYVPSAESRRLLGPDTATRRLYEVKASNHSFGGGEDALMHSLDDAMKWVLSAKSSSDDDSAQHGRRARE